MKGIIILENNETNRNALLPLIIGILITLTGIAGLVYCYALESETIILLLSVASMIGGLYSVYLVLGTVRLASNIPDIDEGAGTATIRHRKAENGPYYIVESDDILHRDGSQQTPFHDARSDVRTGRESEIIVETRAILICATARKGEPDSMNSINMRIDASFTGVNFRP